MKFTTIFAKTKHVFFMREFKTNFKDGTGELNIQYEGTAGTTEAPVASDCNCGEDRTVQVNFITDDGGASKTVTVNQEGVREQFIPADQTEGMRGSDGELFLGIKGKYVDALPDCCIPKAKEPCIYTTTGANRSVRIINKKEYAKRIYLEDGAELDVSGSGALDYTFSEAGDHKVWIILKPDVTSLFSCFRDCSRLTSIPGNLFVNNTVVTDFTSCFIGCSGLTSIPDNLFANNTAVTDFDYCFQGCSGLTSIPDNLFANNTAVTDFDYCFQGCSGLTSIPGNLFENNTAVTNFNGCFSNCSGLTSIPENLFINNTAVTNFGACFQGCTNLTSSCPIDNDGTPIYNRSGNGKEGYAVVGSYRLCFSNCTKMADYASIPSGWKQ